MLLAGLLLVLASAAAPSDGNSPAPSGANVAIQTGVPSSAPTPSADDQTVVCKTIAVTGTRFPTQECRTKGAWAAQTAAARDFVNKATSGVCTGSVCH